MYNEWYECAKFYATNTELKSILILLFIEDMIVCTKEFIDLIIGKNGENIYSGDKYTNIEIMKCLKEIFIILTTKPKFTKLCEGNDGIEFIQWLSPHVVEILVNFLKDSRVEDTKKQEILKVIIRKLELGLTLVKTDSIYSKYMYNIDPIPIIDIACNDNSTFLIRDSSCSVLVLYFQLYGPSQLPYYIKNVSDSHSFSLLWELPIFSSPDFVNSLVNQINILCNQQNSQETIINTWTTLSEKLLTIEKNDEMITCIVLLCHNTLTTYEKFVKDMDKPSELLSLISTLIKLFPRIIILYYRFRFIITFYIY